MHFIYKITNLINGKVYIGSSCSSRGEQSRWLEHKSHSRNPNSSKHKYPLYCAMRKYGIENFSYEIIEKNIETLQEREKIERQYILQFNSIDRKYGYNQTLNTNSPLADIKTKEKIATKLYSIDINTREEVYYDSVCDAARECGASRTCIYSCINGSNKYWEVKNKIFRRYEDNKIIECDITIKERLEEYDKKNPVIDGVRHSITEWCNIYGITRQAYYARLKKGMDHIKALTIPKKKK